jgi:hypothetical protein
MRVLVCVLHKYLKAVGAAVSLAMWDGQPAENGNSAIASRRVAPCLALQLQGYDLGLQEELESTLRLADAARLKGEGTVVRWFPTQQWMTSQVHAVCDKCNKLIDVVEIDQNCPCQFRVSFP